MWAGSVHAYTVEGAIDGEGESHSSASALFQGGGWGKVGVV